MNFLNFSPTIQIRLCLQFITTLATMSVSPFLVIFFSIKLGTLVTGFMFIGVMLASVVGSFIGGYFADRKGRKRIIILAEFVVCLGYILAALANSPWTSLPYVTFILFVIIHFCSGTAGPAYQALIIDESNPQNRKSIYTFTYWFSNLAIAIGGIIGAFLFKNHHFILFIGVAIITLFSLIVTILFIKETYIVKKETRDTVTPQISYMEAFKHHAFLSLAFANMLIICVEEQLTNYIGIRLSKVLSEPTNLVSFLDIKVDGINMIGLLKSENTILVVFLTMFISLIFKRYKDRSILVSGLVLFFIGYTVISFSQIPILLILSMLIATIGELMHSPIRQTLLANMVPDHARSTYMAVYGITTLIGASMAGVVILISNSFPPFVISGSFMLMGLISIKFCYRLTESQGDNRQDVKATVSL